MKCPRRNGVRDMAKPKNSTGEWPSSSFGGTAEYTASQPHELIIAPGDREILRRLAAAVRGIADLPEQEDKRGL